MLGASNNTYCSRILQAYKEKFFRNYTYNRANWAEKGLRQHQRGLRETLSQGRQLSRQHWPRGLTWLQTRGLNTYVNISRIKELIIREERKGAGMKRRKASINHVMLDCSWRNQRRLTVSSRTDKDTGVRMYKYAYPLAQSTEGAYKNGISYSQLL